MGKDSHTTSLLHMQFNHIFTMCVRNKEVVALHSGILRPFYWTL